MQPACGATGKLARPAGSDGEPAERHGPRGERSGSATSSSSRIGSSTSDLCRHHAVGHHATHSATGSRSPRMQATPPHPFPARRDPLAGRSEVRREPREGNPDLLHRRAHPRTPRGRHGAGEPRPPAAEPPPPPPRARPPVAAASNLAELGGLSFLRRALRGWRHRGCGSCGSWSATAAGRSEPAPGHPLHVGSSGSSASTNPRPSTPRPTSRPPLRTGSAGTDVSGLGRWPRSRP